MAALAGLRLVPYALPLKRPWVAASAVLAERRGTLVGVVGADGLVGWGDCAPLPSSSPARLERVTRALSHLARTLPGRDEDEARHGLAALASPEASWAAETALADLAARRRGLPLAVHLGGTVRPVAVNAALGALDDGCAARAAQARRDGFAMAKVKVGLGPPRDEAAALRRLVAGTEGRLILRLDANRAWSEADARFVLESVADLPIDGMEEPLAEPGLDSLARLQALVPFALAVDESLAALGLDSVLEHRPVRRLVVKPARFGGMNSVLELARRARDAGMELVLTSVVDSAIGVTAAAHLAAALPLAATHGLATLDWLQADTAPPPVLSQGAFILPTGPGLGLVPFDQPGQGGALGLAVGEQGEGRDP